MSQALRLALSLPSSVLMPGTGKEALLALHGARVPVLGATIEGPACVRALPDTIEARWLPA